jgi:hypothetical protein
VVQEYQELRIFEEKKGKRSGYVIQKCKGKYYLELYEHACGRDFGNEKRPRDYHREDERGL